MMRWALRILPITMLVVGSSAFVFYVVSGVERGLSLNELDLSFAVAFGLFLPLGTFIVNRRPGHSVGWIMTVIGFAVLVGHGATEYATRGLLFDPGSLPAAAEVAFASELFGVPGIALMAILMLVFPTGTYSSTRWAWVGRVALANTVLIFLSLCTTWSRRGPVLLRDEPPDDLLVPVAVFEVGWIILITSAVAGLLSLFVRFRQSTGVERQQLKWMGYVAALAGTLVVLNFFIFDPLGVDDPSLRLASEQLLNVAVAGIPIAAAIAISRYRLYEIDVVINRTLVYGTLTAILVGTYVGLVFGLQALLAPVTADSDLAVAASTLAVAALFRPLRARVQRFIDHRFYRRKFDAQRTLEDFSSHVRDEVELSALSSRLTRVVAETMQPAHVSLWLKNDQMAIS